MWLCLVSSKQFEDTFKNAQWRKVKQMRPMWLWMLVEDTFENTQWRKFKQMSGGEMYYNHLRQFMGTFIFWSKLYWTGFEKWLKIVGKITQFSGQMLQNSYWVMLMTTYPSCPPEMTKGHLNHLQSAHLHLTSPGHSLCFWQIWTISHFVSKFTKMRSDTNKFVRDFIRIMS